MMPMGWTPIQLAASGGSSPGQAVGGDRTAASWRVMGFPHWPAIRFGSSHDGFRQSTLLEMTSWTCFGGQAARSSVTVDLGGNQVLLVLFLSIDTLCNVRSPFRPLSEPNNPCVCVCVVCSTSASTPFSHVTMIFPKRQLTPQPLDAFTQ